MNEQPGQLISFLALLGFISIAVYYAIIESQNPQQKKKKSKDWMIPVLTVYEQRREQMPIKPRHLPPPPPLPRSKPQKPIIFDDCILSLVATGYKKNDAKKITEKIFQSYNPKTIEEFIRIAFTK